MIKSYCLKETKITENINTRIVKTETNRLMELSNCANCGGKKARFIKQ